MRIRTFTSSATHFYKLPQQQQLVIHFTKEAFDRTAPRRFHLLQNQNRNHQSLQLVLFNNINLLLRRPHPLFYTRRNQPLRNTNLALLPLDTLHSFAMAIHDGQSDNENKIKVKVQVQVQVKNEINKA